MVAGELNAEKSRRGYARRRYFIHGQRRGENILGGIFEKRDQEGIVLEVGGGGEAVADWWRMWSCRRGIRVGKKSMIGSVNWRHVN